MRLSNFIFTENLSTTEAKKMHKELVDFLMQCNEAYYGLDDPLVEDSRYDALVRILHQIEEAYSLQSKEFHKVGHTKKSSGFKAVKHSMPMMSLDNAFSNEDLLRFDEKIKRFLLFNQEDNLEYFSELKIDGLSLSLRYENGRLEQALTRGDGEYGEDVINNAKTVADIPKYLIGNFPEILEVRGEIYIHKEDFFILNEKLKKEDKKMFANPRNLAAGSLRQLDSEITATRPLRFIAWGFGEIIGNNFTMSNFSDIYPLLLEYGFKINSYNKKCSGIDELIAHYIELENLRAQLPFDIDGMVYKINSLALQERLGNLIKSPRWAIAHKFQSEMAVTCINNIVVQVGRSGVLTPVAEMEPVSIGGVSVCRASLHNWDEIKRKDIRIGDSVIIKRAGDVIPQVVEVILSKRLSSSVEFPEPKLCPECSSKVEKIDDEVAIRCTGGVFYCRGMLIEAMVHFVSRGGFDIEGLAEKQIILFNKLGWLTSPADIFLLKEHAEVMQKLEGFGEKSIGNLLSSIEKARNISLHNFIYSLGIRQIGEKIAKVLAKHFKSFDNLLYTFKHINTLDSEISEQINISGLGESILQDLERYFKSKNNLDILQKLLPQIHVQDYQELQFKVDNILYAKHILFSGTLEKISRHEAKDMAERHGAIILSSVSKKLDYLIVGRDPGSKLTKAKELSITILNEDEFLHLLYST